MADALTKDCQPPLSVVIAPIIPYIRRYARALTGNRQDGDSVVEEMLKTLIGDTSRFDRSRPARTSLFALFHEVWEGGETTRGTVTRSRQYLLLTSIEELSPSDAASVLGLPAEDAPRLNEEARSLLSTLIKGRIAIIEDEPAIALDLSQLVEDIGHEVTGVADTRESAVRLALETTPDLILADIQLADGSSGIDAVEEILQSIDAPVIYITAYPERLLTGARSDPTYLIGKPFRDEHVHATISHALYNCHTARGEAAA